MTKEGLSSSCLRHRATHPDGKVWQDRPCQGGTDHVCSAAVRVSSLQSPAAQEHGSPRVQEVTTRFTPCSAAVTLITLAQSKQHAAGLMLTWCQKFFKTCRDVDIDVPALCLSFSQFLDAGNPILHAAYSAQKGKKLRKSSELCRVVNPEWRRTSAGRWTIVAKLGAKSAAQPWRWLRLQEVGFVNNS